MKQTRENEAARLSKTEMTCWEDEICDAPVPVTREARLQMLRYWEQRREGELQNALLYPEWQ